MRDPRDGNIVYSAGQGVARSISAPEQGQDISPVPLDSSGHGVADMPHRFQWTEPILVSPHDPNVFIQAAKWCFAAVDEGKSWQVISPDLTPMTRRSRRLGGRHHEDNTSVEYYDTVSRWRNRRRRKGCFGREAMTLIYVTRNGRQKWDNVTPKQCRVSMVSLMRPRRMMRARHGSLSIATSSRFEAVIMSLAILARPGRDRHRYSEGSFVRAIREDPRNGCCTPNRNGVFVSVDAGHIGSLATEPAHSACA